MWGRRASVCGGDLPEKRYSQLAGMKSGLRATGGGGAPGVQRGLCALSLLLCAPQSLQILVFVRMNRLFQGNGYRDDDADTAEERSRSPSVTAVSKPSLARRDRRT